MRGPFQGVTNILRFNWHFFVLAGAIAAVLAGVGARLEGTPRLIAWGAAALLLVTTLVSLAASHEVYDRSGFYRLDWLTAVPLDVPAGAAMANVHAGFDETTALLRARYPEVDWVVLDFYDPADHTEVSIRRARRAHPPSPADRRVDTTRLPLADGSLTAVFLILAVHEIRDPEERSAFFGELHRVLTDDGTVVVVEHLRDLRNFIAYTLGFFHFLSRRAWLRAFDDAGFRIARSFAPTRLMTCFVLEKA